MATDDRDRHGRDAPLEKPGTLEKVAALARDWFRAYLVYGSDTEKYKSLTESGLLPPNRAVRCKNEWRQIEASWSQLLAPYVK